MIMRIHPPLLLLMIATLAHAAEPGRTIVVAQGSPAADDGNPATAAAPLRTIAAAVRTAGPGDTVLVHAGIYREHIAPAVGGEEKRPLVFQAAPGERVVVRGSDEITAWVAHAGAPGVFATPVAALAGAGQNPYLTTLVVSPGERKGAPADEVFVPPAARPAADPLRLPQTLGLVFAAGCPLREVASEAAVAANPMTWTVTADGGQLIANFGHERLADVPQPIEVAVRARLFAPSHRGLGWIQVRGFTFEHCANPGPFPQAGAVALRAGHHWLIEGNTIRFAKTIGLDLGNEHWNLGRIAGLTPAERTPITGIGNVVRGNVVSDNGLCGIAGIGHEGTLVTGNLVERNAWLDFDGSDQEWEEVGGIKLHAGSVVEGNVVRDNEGYGIWLDNVRGGRVSRNVVVNNKGAGIFLELGRGDMMVDTNLVAMTRRGNAFYDGIGIYTHDVSGAVIAHNLVVDNAGSGIEQRVLTDRKIDGKLVDSSRNAILNNIILDNAQAALVLPGEDPRAVGNRSDFNLLTGNRDVHQGMEAGWPRLFGVSRYACTFDYDALRARADGQRAAARMGPLSLQWNRDPVLDLATWQGLTGFDAHSREQPAAFRVLVRARALSLRIDYDGKLADFRCPPVPGITRDLMGAALPPGDVLPGPFLTWTTGRIEQPLPIAGIH
jgi:parallel beta-helix repeat protein